MSVFSPIIISAIGFKIYFKIQKQEYDSFAIASLMLLVEFEWEQVTGYEDETLQDIMLLYKRGVQKLTLNRYRMHRQ